jgi:HEAT repeat protein
MISTHRILVILTVLSTFQIVASPSRAQDALPEPVLQIEDGSFHAHTYGDADNVRWLADLLKDPDPLVRERAVMDLGQTDNRLAAGLIASALKDADLGVRCTALAAMAELAPNLARPLVLEALGDQERIMVLAALRLASSLRLADSRSAVEKLLSRSDLLIVSNALGTLTVLGLPAPAESLKGMLASPQATVRLRAAQNAMYAQPAADLAEPLLKIARADDPQIRACALAALGKSAYASVEPLLAEAARSKDAALRRGALWAWRYAGKTDRIRPFLDDESPMVVLAAVEAVGDLKFAPCAARVTELLTTVKDDRAHLAARAALVRIGQDSVPPLVAEALKKIVPNILRIPGAASAPTTALDGELVNRNVRSLAWILGQYRSKVGLDVQMDLVRKLPVDNAVLPDLAGAMALAGDERARDPIRAALGVAAANAPSYLVFMRTGKGGHAPFSEAVTAALVDAAGQLKDAQAVPVILRLAEMDDQGTKLPESAAAAARVLPLLVGDTNRAAIEKAVLGMLGEKARSAYGVRCTFDACKTAARLKLAAAVPLMEKVLAEHENRQLIQASAWAIGQLTGKTPPLPEPARRQGQWTIRAVE